ncbi:glucoamylase family protein [Agriterribacter sp.]|uniref:glucoamylase family protein n=1 Tax=Agriterribacter sp. TaxID=2821509 RepID=UPI002B96F560|nr:glucoamylase family protein [Agriterribacter sp.]HRP57222.1 glucoamylase family protein [Agriterribacter sp.]
MRTVIPLHMVLLYAGIVISGCSKKSSATDPVIIPPAPSLISESVTINGLSVSPANYNINNTPAVKLSFNAPVNRSTVNGNLGFKNKAGVSVDYSVAYEEGDSTVVVLPTYPLSYIANYIVNVSTGLKSVAGGTLASAIIINFTTQIDSSRKFPIISDNALLDSVQKRTFSYFWKLSHPVSGMARERNSDANIYTSGGTGFGIMAIVTAIHRNFITRAEGLTRLQAMVSFLKNTAETFHGAYPHWLNGTTGKVIPFSTNDNGADLVETSFLIQGLLIARQYFNGTDGAEAGLRNDINSIVNNVEWDWFRKDNENVLYWHWSAVNTNGWEMNHRIKGWNECLVTYVLAASSTTHPVPKNVYQNGWASNGDMKNNNIYYGLQLPLGPSLGGPLFFAHYSFLGINPTDLTDAYANYWTQNKSHTLINYNYCKSNPLNYFGYSDSVWGLSASDIENGYTASSPTNDVGVIAPTAAISSLPYTPAESMKALKFFYYVLGDKIWKEHGFVDAFSLHDTWFADSFLAIDQGPIIVMIENYRSGLLWDLFMSCPEVKAGMRELGFTSPHL